MNLPRDLDDGGTAGCLFKNSFLLSLPPQIWQQIATETTTFCSTLPKLSCQCNHQCNYSCNCCRREVSCVKSNEEVNDKPADCIFCRLMSYRSCHPATQSCPARHWNWKDTTENDTKERIRSQRTLVTLRVCNRVGHALRAHSRQHGTCFN